MRIPENYRKCVVFLGRREYQAGKDVPAWVGTAFVVSHPGRRRQFFYLVTAKHCADRLNGFDFEIRYNTTRGYFRTQEFGNDTRWWRHPTEPDSVDAAVLPFDVGAEDGDIEHVPTAPPFWLTREELHRVDIGAGDEVFIIGLFSKLAGEGRNVSLVRTGNVAMIPDKGEKIPYAKVGNYFGPIEGYLIEARSIGGLSGSPVFVRETIQSTTQVRRRSGELEQCVTFTLGPQHLLGLMHGHWEVLPKDKNKTNILAQRKNEETVNLGIGIVVPACKILEVINHPELQAMRDNI